MQHFQRHEAKPGMNTKETWLHLIVLSLAEKLLALSWVSWQVTLAIAQKVEDQPKVLQCSSQGQQNANTSC